MWTWNIIRIVVGPLSSESALSAEWVRSAATDATHMVRLVSGSFSSIRSLSAVSYIASLKWTFHWIFSPRSDTSISDFCALRKFSTRGYRRGNIRDRPSRSCYSEFVVQNLIEHGLVLLPWRVVLSSLLQWSLIGHIGRLASDQGQGCHVAATTAT